MQDVWIFVQLKCFSFKIRLHAGSQTLHYSSNAPFSFWPVQELSRNTDHSGPAPTCHMEPQQLAADGGALQREEGLNLPLPRLFPVLPCAPASTRTAAAHSSLSYQQSGSERTSTPVPKDVHRQASERCAFEPLMPRGHIQGGKNCYQQRHEPLLISKHHSVFFTDSPRSYTNTQHACRGLMESTTKLHLPKSV